MRLLKGLTVFYCLLGGIPSIGQSAFINNDQNYNHLIDRLEIKSGLLINDFHTTIKPFERKALAQYLSGIDTLSFLKLMPKDKWNYNYLKTDNWEWLRFKTDSTVKNEKPLLKVFFKTPAEAFYTGNKDFDLHVSPIVQFQTGTNPTADYKSQFINTRGVEIRGHINQKLGFYTSFTENQQSTADYQRSFNTYYKGFPYQGYTKVSNDDSLKMNLDYINAIGYLVFYPSKNIMLKFGHSTNFIGNGIRSFMLSDFTAPYLNLTSSVKLGRLEYFNMVAQMSNAQIDRGVNNTIPIPPKYMALHHLNINITKWLNAGIFESILFAPRTTGFELNYLNPIILYRFVETLNGSADNALVGADFKLNLLKSVQFYGQYVLDEFNQKEFNKNGWWGKKNAKQIGVKYIDFLKINQLDLQAEFNSARPFIYSHYSSYSNYSNFNIPLAHPLGANFNEYLIRLSYQPTNKLSTAFTYMHYSKGLDTEVNFGGDILRNNRLGKASEYGHSTTQGLNNKVDVLLANASYMLYHNVFADVSFTYRNANTEGLIAETRLLQLGLRWNILQKEYLY